MSKREAIWKGVDQKHDMISCASWADSEDGSCLKGPVTPPPHSFTNFSTNILAEHSEFNFPNWLTMRSELFCPSAIQIDEKTGLLPFW